MYPTLKVIVRRDSPNKRLDVNAALDAHIEAAQTETEQLQRIELENLDWRKTA